MEPSSGDYDEGVGPSCDQSANSTSDRDFIMTNINDVTRLGYRGRQNLVPFPAALPVNRNAGVHVRREHHTHPMRNDLTHGETKWDLLSITAGDMEIPTGWNIPGCSRIHTSISQCARTFLPSVSR
ncbi:hypothetical protein B0W47_06035 [Komagataeibacter nataicola]|uniref:Uncharacterized protein n=4 Tax=Acetobacteraceae TaxID=433 RepID=A0A9N7H2R2_9PROT|nr:MULTISPECIES: hypothetical protein [Acetobacteraceae]AQU87108.1 hypothetical protein B0W47_06035 [Komagataeibacter nataicola]KPH87924.1 hypothetical protein GLUCOINTEAF2_0204021 [Komagataeibacter intermedius AF2]MBV1824892.1 hypothetical protein [Komagataeibacter oboediens]MCJ8352891.1 hypothetical protein [Novacetimonas hansenii]PYD65657.1 hypothetical protein CDI09_12510 [Komagataeibacter nataicola]